MTKTKTNKWVDLSFGKNGAMIRDGDNWRHLEPEDIKMLRDRTQQETLEWCLKVTNQRTLAKDPVGEISQIIKNKMEDYGTKKQ